MNDPVMAADYACMVDISLLVIEKCQITRFGFGKQTDHLTLGCLLAGIAQQVDML